jgi:hypothetical protein
MGMCLRVLTFLVLVFAVGCASNQPKLDPIRVSEVIGMHQNSIIELTKKVKELETKFDKTISTNKLSK